MKGIFPTDSAREVKLTDRLVKRVGDRYDYTTEGFPGLTSLTGSFSVTRVQGRAQLSWNCTLAAQDPTRLVCCLAWLAGTADDMSTVLQNYFDPETT